MSGFLTRGWQNSRVISAKVCKTEVDVTSSTTLVNVSGLGHKLQSGVTYIFDGWITGTAGASGGAKVALVGDGVLTASQFAMTANNFNGATTNASTSTTTLGNAVGAATAVFTDIQFRGSIVVGKAGVAYIQIAQNASNGTATSAYVGSYIRFIPVD